MSYDIRIWSAKKPQYDDKFFREESFKRLGESLVYKAKEWQIVINETYQVDDEDIPQDILSLLPGIKYLTEINLEPISAPEKARKILSRISKILAKSSYGIIVDEQADVIETPMGVKRLESFTIKENKTIMDMTWWFINEDRLKNGGLRDLINLIELNIPEAMPRRYGLFEPPQFRLVEQGKENFVKFMYENIYEHPVWYPNKPFDFISISIPNPIGPMKIGFRTGKIEFQFYEEALKLPGWPLSIKRFWLRASEIIDPFYSEIKKGNSPVGSWWWNGIPRCLGNAALIGKPYIDLWPEFTLKANQTDSGHLYIENIEDEEYKDIHSIVGSTPEGIAQPIKVKKQFSIRFDAPLEEKEAFFAAVEEESKNKYPEIWPFDGPFKEE